MSRKGRLASNRELEQFEAYDTYDTSYEDRLRAKRWLSGTFGKPEEVGQAYAFFVELTEPGAGVGIDYKRWSEAMLQDCRRYTGGDPSDLFRSWRVRLERVILSSLPDPRNRDIWGLSAIYGDSNAQIARRVGLSAERVRQVVNECNEAILGAVRGGIRLDK